MPTILTCNRYFVVLRRKHSLSQSLHSLSVKYTALLWVREILTIKEFEFSILINKREDGDSIIVESNAFGSGEQE